MNKITIQEYSDIADRIFDKVEELNQLMEEGHEKGLNIGVNDTFLRKHSRDEPTRAVVSINLRFNNNHN